MTFDGGPVPKRRRTAASDSRNEQDSAQVSSQLATSAQAGTTGHAGPSKVELSRNPVSDSTPGFAFHELEEATSKDPSVTQLPPVTSGAYSNRELHLQRLEKANEITFTYVLNDGTPQNMIWLTGLKNIFSKQLPNMPKEYIARLVFDKRHRSVAVIRNADRLVVGGITYRSFPEQGFGEIAFCAITSNEQVKGFGTRLMNHTKETAKSRDGLSHFLTYADNNAVGYFLKQGFTKEITLNRDKWVGYIKDYDGGTLMEAVLNFTLNYTEFPQMILQQRQALDSHIRHLSKSHIVYPGLTHFKKNGNAKPLDLETIPGMKEAGWSAERHPGPSYHIMVNNTKTVPTPSVLQRFMLELLKELRNREEAWPFHVAVDANEVPDYYEVIKDPIHIEMMETRLKHKNYYVSFEIFLADLRRMFANARVYNNPDTVYYKYANKLDTFLDHYLAERVIYRD